MRFLFIVIFVAAALTGGLELALRQKAAFFGETAEAAFIRWSAHPHTFPDAALGRALTPGWFKEIPLGSRTWKARHAAIPGQKDFGFRGEKADAANGRPDLVVLGGSETYALEQDEEETWPRRLAKSSSMTVVNLGVPDYGTTQATVLFGLRGKSLRPKTMILVLDSAAPLANARFRDYLENKADARRPECWDAGFAPLSRRCETLLLLRETVLGQWLLPSLRRALAPSRPYVARSGAQSVCADLDQLNALATERKARFFVFRTPALGANEKEIVDACAARLKIHLEETSGDLAAAVQRTINSDTSVSAKTTKVTQE